MNPGGHGPHRNRHYYRPDQLAVPTDEVTRPETCPRCGQPLQQEPAFAFCRLGCGRVFVVDRTALADQRRAEVRTR